LNGDRFSRIDYTLYRHGDTAAMFSLWLDGVDEDDFTKSLAFLTAAAKHVLDQI
jgi:hypothetical protein